MLEERLNWLHWTWMIFLEMWLAGIAAGLALAVFFLAVSGRGRSPAARTAQLLAFPLMLIVTFLLIIDLGRPERFWHMVIMNEQLRPIVKPWSPISLGTWLVIIFTTLAFVSFVDALVDSGRLRLGRWRHGQTLRGPAGMVWSTLMALSGLSVAIYSGVLLAVSRVPGWGHVPFLPVVYVVSAAATGIAALVLVHALTRRIDPDVIALARTNTWFIAFWLLLAVAFVVGLLMAGGRVPAYFLSGGYGVALIAAIVLGGIVPLVLRARYSDRRPATLAISAALVLIGGLLLRISIVMGPQEWLG